MIAWTAACQASLSITISWSLLKFLSIESVMPSNHFIFCHPLLLLPSIFPSMRVFSKDSVLCIRWLKYWSFSFSISPSNEYSGLTSFRMDWLDLLAVQGTLKSLFQHHNSKASILQHSAFFIVQLSYLHMKVKVKSLSHIRLFATPWTLAYQAPPSMGFSRQEYWSVSFSISPSNKYSELSSFRMDDLISLQDKELSIVFSITAV